jgi:hypothetical protein
MTVIPGEALRFVYEKYGARLLEANVRSVLSATQKVNTGIRNTLKEKPERFMAYNNGIVIVADQLHLGKTSDGGPGVLWLKEMQIVNGGQTTASIYFTKRKNPEIDLRRVHVPAKIIVLRLQDSIGEEALISDIPDLRRTKLRSSCRICRRIRPFHVHIDNLALSTYCPDGIGRWFLRTRGGQLQYHALARRGLRPHA